MAISFIDLKPQYKALKSDIDARIQKILDHGQFILGPEVAECESALSKFTKAKHSITCSNGSDAIQMAMMALGIGAGDEVITTAFSFIATAEMIVLSGATPVLIDIDPKTYNLNPDLIEKVITKKTKAIMPVSLYGQMADMDAVTSIADKHGLFIIEDGAQSFGATFNGRRSCTFKHIGCTSFFPAKPLGCYGDGGALFTDSDELANNLKSIRMHGMGEHRYQHTRLGINGRLDSIQCAVITAKLNRYGWEIEERNKIAKNYTDAFSSLKSKGVTTPHIDSRAMSVWAQYTLQVPDRKKFQASMQEKGVPTAVHYPVPMADQPAYKNLARSTDIPVARKCSEHVVSLPMYPDMTPEVQNTIISAVISSI